MTAKGGQFAAASFARRISRGSGNEIVAGVLERAADVDAQRHFAFRIVKIALFGSMLEDTPLVSDVDLAVHVLPKFVDARFDQLSQQRIEVAEDAAMRFRSRIHSTVWPRQELTEYIRGGERDVSVHSFTELELLGCRFRILWGQPPVGQI
jgi:predicted nucleotidyltransferase